jgi:hypothetical protein
MSDAQVTLRDRIAAPRGDDEAVRAERSQTVAERVDLLRSRVTGGFP